MDLLSQFHGAFTIPKSNRSYDWQINKQEGPGNIYQDVNLSVIKPNQGSVIFNKVSKKAKQQIVRKILQSRTVKPSVGTYDVKTEGIEKEQPKYSFGGKYAIKSESYIGPGTYNPFYSEKARFNYKQKVFLESKWPSIEVDPVGKGDYIQKVSERIRELNMVDQKQAKAKKPKNQKKLEPIEQRSVYGVNQSKIILDTMNFEPNERLNSQILNKSLLDQSQMTSQGQLLYNQSVHNQSQNLRSQSISHLKGSILLGTSQNYNSQNSLTNNYLSGRTFSKDARKMDFILNRGALKFPGPERYNPSYDASVADRSMSSIPKGARELSSCQQDQSTGPGPGAFNVTLQNQKQKGVSIKGKYYGNANEVSQTMPSVGPGTYDVKNNTIENNALPCYSFGHNQSTILLHERSPGPKYMVRANIYEQNRAISFTKGHRLEDEKFVTPGPQEYFQPHQQKLNESCMAVLKNTGRNADTCVKYKINYQSNEPGPVTYQNPDMLNGFGKNKGTQFTHSDKMAINKNNYPGPGDYQFEKQLYIKKRAVSTFGKSNREQLFRENAASPGVGFYEYNTSSFAIPKYCYPKQTMMQKLNITNIKQLQQRSPDPQQILEEFIKDDKIK